MKIFKRFFCFWVFVFLSVSLHVYANSVPAEVAAAADSGLIRMLNSIPPGFESSYGFDNRDEFDHAYTGEPYRMCTISPAKLDINYRGAATIEPLHVWRFPVICSGRVRSLLTVAQMKGEWRAVEIGAAGLAAEFAEFEKKLSAKEKMRNRVLLRLFQFKCDYIGLLDYDREMEEGTFYPLKSASINLDTSKPAEGLSFRELLDFLQETHEKKKDFLPEFER